MRYEIERLADAVLDAMPEDPYPLRVLQVCGVCSAARAAQMTAWQATSCAQTLAQFR